MFVCRALTWQVSFAGLSLEEVQELFQRRSEGKFAPQAPYQRHDGGTADGEQPANGSHIAGGAQHDQLGTGEAPTAAIEQPV